MDDIGKAIVMVGHVLLFIFSVTVAIILYSRLTNSAEAVLESLNNSNRGDAIVDIGEADFKRQVSGAEVVLAILDLKNKAGAGINSSVGVDDTIYEYDSSNDRIKIITPSLSGYLDYNSSNLREHMLISGNYLSKTYTVVYSNDYLKYVHN